MKSAQFIHIETYSKKSAKKADKKNHSSDVRQTNVKGVLSEARRDDGFTSHIDVVEAPTTLYGCSIDELEALADEYHANGYTVDKNGVQKKLRSDASILLAGVISLNKSDSDIWEEYKKDAVEYLKKKYGKNLKCVIEHTDETNPHIHFYVVASPGENLNDFHDGKLAVSKLSKEEKKDQKTVYTKAMTMFQDDFYFKVSKKYGLDRLGEKPRKRMSRKEYLEYEAEKQLSQTLLDEKNTEIQKIDEIVSEARTDGFNQGLEEGLEKSSKIAETVKNFIDKLRFTKTDLEIQLENELSTLKSRFSNLVKRKNMYKKKSIDMETNYKRIREKYQKTNEFKEELKQHQMNVKISSGGSGSPSGSSGSGIAGPAPKPGPRAEMEKTPDVSPSADPPKKIKL
ncbi:plasmid recombination protein [Pantoea anthophila]|uniref:plasmid recombination protein n=1 Tax=Pantoea anthophila TaxID=470931 RepID=UPI002DC03D9A|nr:plasmid recombination protein [Pantoea anthophila]MEB5708465.1 plasmid recombination protein [Pantoea anthophila]MEB6519341.1 plasmid recombination protein [Pantoea anthophila]